MKKDLFISFSPTEFKWLYQASSLSILFTLHVLFTLHILKNVSCVDGRCTPVKLKIATGICK